MKIRIQPPEFEISAKDPFEHDLLGRSESIKALTRTIGSIEGPCVMAVDAGWGMGKTTFLRMWAQHLRNEQFPVVEFNAWETDFAQDPFIALTSEIATGLQNLGSTAGRLGGHRLRSAATYVVRATPGATVRVVASGVPFFGSRLAQELEPKQPSLHQTMVGHYSETKAALQAFRSSLAAVADASARDNKGRALVVLVDELDRCRPTYAVELLEAAKHLFSVDRIVFVLCLDRAQLASSVKALYGESFNADGYLRRFFDIDYRLPTADRGDFVRAALASVRIEEWLQTHRRDPGADTEFLPAILHDFLSGSQLSLRDVLQAVHRLGTVLASMGETSALKLLVATVLLMLRTVEPSLYRRMLDGDMADQDVVDGLFNSVRLAPSFPLPPRAAAEGVLIASAILFRADHHGRVDTEQARLFNRYRQDDQDSEWTSSDAQLAHLVLGNVEMLLGIQELPEGLNGRMPMDRVGIRDVVRFLELLTDDRNEVAAE